MPFTLRNSIVANNPGSNCQGSVIDGGDNFQFNPDTGCGGSIISGDPKMSLISNNGGSTQTMALGAGSAAVNLGNAITCAASVGSPNFGAGSLDSRGMIRGRSGFCDSGAFEAQPANIAVNTGSLQTTIINTNFPLPLLAQAKDAFNHILGGIVVTYTVPASGASALLVGNPATTNVCGIASVTATANGTAG